MIKQRIALLLLLCSLTLTPLLPQQYRYPLTITPQLSGNFGELRNNHFHSGLDFKTEQVENKPILAVEDGYVSRVSVTSGGFGNAIYITHPATGHTTVYGHLNSFFEELAEWVKEQQYKQESFRVNLYPGKGSFPVKRGEQIALSGNRGSSGGPHLHFEVRDARNEEPLDPLEYLPVIQDREPPDLRGIAFYPVAGKGVINNSINPIRLNIGKNSSGNPQELGTLINAWGRIGIGIKAYDLMSGQSNIYGVKHIKLFVDEEMIFSSTISRFSFAESRMLNSFIDFEDWRNRRSLFMKSFIEPGNSLPFYQSVNNGYIDIKEEREYKFRYELTDHYGNQLTYSFAVHGKQEDIPKVTDCENLMSWNLNNSIIKIGFTLYIPIGNLYSNICFNYNEITDSSYHSNIYQLHDTPVPLHNKGEVWIKLLSDTLTNKKNYGIVKINEDGTDSWVGGRYARGGISASISELGDKYAVSCDTVPPTITAVAPENWVNQREIRIRLRDNKSGISSFRGEINGKWVLFRHDSKSTIYSYRFDNSRLKKGETETLVFRATDSAGNSSSYSYSFRY